MYRLKRPIHSSWLIALASLGFVCGVVAVPAGGVPMFASLAWLMTGLALVLFALVRQRMWVIGIVLLGGAVLGLWRGGLEFGALQHYRPLYGQMMTLSGTLADDSDTDKRGHMVLRLRDVRLGDKPMAGQVWVVLSTKAAPVQRSDVVRVEGKMSEGFGAFAASIFDAELQKIERPEPGDIALKVRDGFSRAVRAVIPEPEASLGVGYLLGQRRALPEELDTALQVTGLTHVVVASGYNLTILVRFARRLFEKISKYTATLASGGLVASFVAITGMSPSMSRAGLVAGLSLAAWYYGRKFHPLVLLPFAAAVTVLVNPSYAWGDVGWQLSFAAFAGVMLLAPLLQAYYFGDKKPGALRQILGETVAAWLCTLPILVQIFGTVSTVAVIANLMVLPLVPLAMLLVFIGGLASLVLPFAAAIAYPATLLLHYMTQTTFWLANVPGGQLEVSVTPLVTIGLYTAIIGLAVYMWWKTRLDLKNSNIIE